jgi:hypothetical protein
MNLWRKKKMQTELIYQQINSSCPSAKGTGKEFSWEIILASRQNWNTPLVDQNGFVSVEDKFAFIWRSKNDYQEYAKQKTVNENFLASELPKARIAYEQAVLNAKKLGSSDRQLRNDFAESYDAKVLENLPFKNIFSALIAKVAIDPNHFKRIAEREFERFLLEKKIQTESIIPLLDPSKISNGFQPAIKLTWNLEKWVPETVREKS